MAQRSIATDLEGLGHAAGELASLLQFVLSHPEVEVVSDVRGEHWEGTGREVDQYAQEQANHEDSGE